MRKIKKKYYVVFEGREQGIFTDWDEVKKYVEHYKGALHKAYKTREEAKQAFFNYEMR